MLLKNDGLLPLRPDLQSMAVIGPNADDLHGAAGQLQRHALPGATLLAGIRDKLGARAKLYYAQRLRPGRRRAQRRPDSGDLPASIGATRPAQPDLTGTYFDNERFEGEPRFTRTDQGVDFVWKDTSPDQAGAAGVIISPCAGRAA